MKKQTDSATIFKKLDEKLDPSYVLTRDNLSYIPGYVAIEQANRIFGYGKWGYSITKFPELVKETDNHSKPAWSYICAVKSWVKIDGETIEREDVGIADVTFTREFTDQKTKQASGGKPQLEVAFKGCITDALKRSLRGFGNQFGNALYDREDRLTGTQAAQLSTAEELGLKDHVQALISCKTEKALEEKLDSLVQIATQDEWKPSHVAYIKEVAERVKRGLALKNARKDKREEKKPVKPVEGGAK